MWPCNNTTRARPTDWCHFLHAVSSSHYWPQSQIYHFSQMMIVLLLQQPGRRKWFISAGSHQNGPSLHNEWVLTRGYIGTNYRQEAPQAAPAHQGEFLIICHCGLACPGLEYWPPNQVLRLEQPDYKEITELQIDRTLLREYSRSNLSAYISGKLFQVSGFFLLCRITGN